MYPKIHSISMVGIRQHDKADYMLHHLRTDFTGDNGLGKSIIADLLQLIFIPLRDEWKPGTEGIDKDERRIDTIPLDRPFISHAYTFLTIEKAKGKFIAMGVQIPRASRSPLRAFIVQRFDDFENKKILVPFEQPITSADFVAENGHIYDMTDLKKRLTDRYGIYLKDFANRSNIDDYFDLLYRNQILPIDLTRETNLRSYAKVLQSFARAKTLNINKSKSLQDFLFEDNEEVRFSFERERETLNDYIRHYQTTRDEIELLVRKQQRLNHLSTLHVQYVSSKNTYLQNNALFTNGMFRKAEREYADNRQRHQRAHDELERAKAENEQRSTELYSALLQQQAVCSELRDRLDAQKDEVNEDNLRRLKQQLREGQALVDKLESLEALNKQYPRAELIDAAWHLQELVKDRQKRLRRLRSIRLFAVFEQSLWAENYNLAYEQHQQRCEEIKQRLQVLSDLLQLYQGQNPDSLFQWSLAQGKPLSRGQETVLMHLREVYTKKMNAQPGARFTLAAAELLQSFEETKTGVWITLGALREFVPFVEKQNFADGALLHQAIETDIKKIKTESSQLQSELDSIIQLHAALQEIGYNQELAEIFQQRAELDAFVVNKLLTEENVDFVKQHISEFDLLDFRKQTLDQLDQKIAELQLRASTLKNELEDLKQQFTQIYSDINTIRLELSHLPADLQTDIGHLPYDALKQMRRELDGNIFNLRQRAFTLRATRDQQRALLDAARHEEPRIKQEREHYERLFAEAKRLLFNETDSKFDDLMYMGDLNQEIIEQQQNAFEQAREIYHSEYVTVAESFDETRHEKRSPELYDRNGHHLYNFYTLVQVLCGRIGLDGLTSELTQLNEKLREFGDLQMKILINVFNEVEKQYKEFENTVRKLNFFFDKNRVSYAYRFRIDFEPRKDINIDWIEKMRAKAMVHKYGPDLFTPQEDLPGADNTPENLIRNIARTFYGSINCDAMELLNPKFYFTLKVRMEDEEGRTNAGSGGQAYTALALLCIGRLSIVQKLERQGVRFILIEELSNIDDTNFNIFPQIAAQFGYQLFTMTPKPFGSYAETDWYLHMLIRGKEEKDRNYKPMSFFKSKYDHVDLNEYIRGK